MRFITLTLLCFCIISCKKEDKTYYPNGSLKTQVGVINSKFHGSYKLFYEDGEIKLEGTYEKGLAQGQFTYYYRSENKFSKSEVLFKDDTAYYRKDYNKSKRLIREGPVQEIPNGNLLHEESKIGKWKYYNVTENYTKEVREFLHIDNTVYLNQAWILNKQGDTIGGNYYKLRAKDTLDFNKQVIHFRLIRPFFDESELYVCLPKKSSMDFDGDFSNQDKVVMDTIKNLARWYKKNNINEYQNNFLDVVIDLNYDTSGKKTLRGFLLEKKSLANIDTLDYDFVTRKIYFDIDVFVKDLPFNH